MVRVEGRDAFALSICTGTGYSIYRITSSKLCGWLAGIGFMCGWVAWKTYPVVRSRRRSIEDLKGIVSLLMDYELYDPEEEIEDETMEDVSPSRDSDTVSIQLKERKTPENILKLANLKYGIPLNLAFAVLEDSGLFELKYLSKVREFIDTNHPDAFSHQDMSKYLRYLQYSAAAYGSLGIRLLNYGFFRLRIASWIPEKTFMANYLGIAEKDIVFVHSDKSVPDSDVKHPRHFVAVDHALKSIILAIRGTFNLGDIITCLFATPVDFCGGIAHNGMVRAAKELVKTVVSIVKRICEKYPSYQVVLCGHSLGAGTAILLMILLKKLNLLENIDIQCVVFAPPPVFAPLEALDEETSRKITCFVLEDDFVSRCQLSSVHRFLTRLIAFDRLEIGLWQRIRIIWSKNLTALEALVKSRYGFRRQQSTNSSPSPSPDRTISPTRTSLEKFKFRDLYIPGAVFLIHKPLLSSTYYTYKVSNGGICPLFYDIIASDSCLSSHYYVKYVDVLQELAETLKSPAS